MFNQLAKYKNHFLQISIPFVPSERINEMAFGEFAELQKFRCKCSIPTKLQAERSTYFDDRAQLAYGFWALPKLVTEMCSDNPVTKWRAINSLSEYLLNPMQAERAILEYDVIRISQNAFLRIRHYFHKEYFRETERLMKIFFVLSHYQNGADDMVRRPNLIKEFYDIILEKSPLANEAACTLRNISEKAGAILYLINNTNAFEYVTRIFTEDVCLPFYPEPLWMHLGHFLEKDPDMAIRAGFFEVLFKRIMGRLRSYHKHNMRCFSFLLRCQQGQNRFDEVDGVKVMYDILRNETLDTYEYVVLALSQGMVSRHSLWRCREFIDLPNLIVKLIQEQNPRLQLYCLKALRLMSDMPVVKRYIRSVCLRELMSFKCLNKHNECIRDDYVRWLQREIYETTDL